MFCLLKGGALCANAAWTVAWCWSRRCGGTVIEGVVPGAEPAPAGEAPLLAPLPLLVFPFPLLLLALLLFAAAVRRGPSKLRERCCNS